MKQDTINKVVAAHDVPTCKHCTVPGDDETRAPLEQRGIETDRKEIRTIYACPRCEHKVTLHDSWPKEKKRK